MRKRELLKTLPALAALCALSISGVNALGSHPGGNPGGGGSHGNHGTTFLTPYYCWSGSVQATDATASFSTLTSSNHHSITVLNLAIPKDSDTDAAYGLVTNNATQAFSTLDFDASNTNSDAYFEVLISQNNGLTDAGLDSLSTLATTATSTTPTGFTHCQATLANLIPESGTLLANNTFLEAVIVQQENNSKNRSLQIANVNLNLSSTTASAVMQQAQNNCDAIL